MANRFEQQILLNFAFGQVTGQKQFQREAERLASDSFAAGTKKGMEDGVKKAQASLSKSVALLHQAGMAPAVKDLREAHRAGARLQEKQSQELLEIYDKLGRETDKNVKKELRARKKQIKDEIKDRQKAQDVLLAKSNERAEATIRLREQHEAKMNRDRVETMQESGEKFQQLVEQAMSLDNVSASTLAESLTKAMGGALQARAGASAAAGQGMSAASLAKLGGSISAIAAPIAALVAVISAAVGNATEMNKALLDNASAYDIAGGNAQQLNVRLSMLRRVALDTATNFRLTKEEVMGGISALNQAGLTVKQFRGVQEGASNDMQAYADVTRTAVLAAQGLGISASEVGDFMKKSVEELGYDLRDIQGAFGMISDEAEKSSMSTKDFFAAITSASSGMALYNFRLDDTVGLFSDLVDILGEDLAKEKVKLEGTFRNMGMQERVKSTMLMGTGNTKKIMQADAKAQAEDFAQTFGQAVDAQKLGQMSQREFEGQLNSMGDPQAKRKFIELRRLSRGAFGGGTLGAARAMGSVSRQGELAMQLSQGAAMTGGGPISEMSDMMRMAFEEMTGVSGEQFDILERIDMGLRAEFEKLGGRAGLGKTFVEALASGDLSEAMGQQEAIKKYTEMEQVAVDSLKETRSINQTLSNTIASYLENIWLGVEHIWKYVESWVGSRDPGSADAGARAQADVFRGQMKMTYGDELAGRRLSGKSVAALADPKEQKLLEELLQEDEKKAQEKSKLDERLASDQAFRDKYTQELLEGGFKDTLEDAKKRRREDFEKENRGLLATLVASGVNEVEANRLLGSALQARSQGLEEQRTARSAIQAALGSTVDPDMASRWQSAGVAISVTDSEKTGDLVYSKGKAYTLNNRDDFYAAKSDGVLAQQGGGSRPNVNIVVNGGDEQRIYSVIKKVLDDTGYNDVRRYGGG